MKKKAHDDYNFNFITLKSADQFVPAAGAWTIDGDPEDWTVPA